MLSTGKYEQFATFFNSKIIAIRQNIITSRNEPTSQFSKNFPCAMSHFDPIDLDN